jgi:hypothetical protein
MVAKMQLLNNELYDRFIQVGSQEEVEDPIVVAKFFNPQGAGRWFATEITSVLVDIEGKREEIELTQWAQLDRGPLDPLLIDVYFFGFVSIFGDWNDELGYFSLSELVSYRGPLGLGIERDLYWAEKPLSHAKAELYGYMHKT